MPLPTALDELTGADLLDHAEDVARQQRECEVQTLRIAVQHAIIHNPATLDPALTTLPGRERARRYGGSGAPEVAEFCCATLAGRLGVSPWSAAALIADGLDITIRLPQLWRRVERLEVKASYARYVARQTRDLTLEQASYVDSRVVEPADGRIAWTRFEDLVAGAVAASDPEAAAEKERARAEEQFARPTRSTEDGMRGFYVRAPFQVITLLDARVAWLADILAATGDTDPIDHRRVKALAILANPHLAVELVTAFQQWQDRPEDPADLPEETAGTDTVPTGSSPTPPESGRERTGAGPRINWDEVLPAVTINVHTYRPGCRCDEPGTGIARIEDIGPVTEAWVRRWLGPTARIRVQPVLDIEHQAPVDGYEIPDRHRQAVRLMTPADTFPFASSTRSGSHQVDHTEPFDHARNRAGRTRQREQSRIGNYGPMTGFHHRIKTHHGGWEIRQPFPGIYLWRDPYGVHYLVDHTGTRRLPGDAGPTGPHTVEIYRVPWSLEHAA